MTFTKHETAIIDQGATIGQGCRIWHWTHVCGGAVIGENCILGQNVFVANKVIIGSGCKIQNNVSIYDNVTIEDEVFCGPSMVFTNVVNPRAFLDRKSEFKNTLVKKGATIGANATIVCGKVIGAFSFIGAGAVVTKDVKDFALVIGAPGKQTGWISKTGEKIPLPINGSGVWECAITHEKYILSNDILICNG